MTITYRFFTTSFTTLGIALVAQFFFHAEPAVAKGGVDNPTVVEDGGGSLRWIPTAAALLWMTAAAA